MFTGKRLMGAVAAGALALAGCNSDSGSGTGGPDAGLAELAELNTESAKHCDHLVPSQCLYPFPNDLFTRPDTATDSGRRIAFADASMPVTQPVAIPASEALPFDIDNDGGGPVEPAEWNRNDGYSPGAMILAHVPEVDLEKTGAAPITDIGSSLDSQAPILLVNADTGERHLIWAELDTRAEPDRQALIVRPAQNLMEGARYVVALRNLKNAEGETLQAPALFRAYRDRIDTGEPVFEQRRDAMEDIFSVLDEHGVDRDELYLAWDFTVASQRSLTERLLHIRDEAFAWLGGGAPAFQITEVSEEVRGSVRDDLSYGVTGTFEVPNFLDQAGGPPGSAFYYGESDDPDALPQQFNNDDTVTARFRCQIPASAVSAFNDPEAEVVPARPALYGHGLFGEGPGGEFVSSDVRDMQDEHNVMFCATDWIGMSQFDLAAGVPHNVLADISEFPQMADRLQQGILNAMFLAELLVHPDGFASHEAFHQGNDELVFEQLDEAFYDGNSQGGIIGGALVATAKNINRGVLGVPGANYSLLLRRFARWNEQFGFAMQAAYPDTLDRTLVLALIQMLWDRGENNGYLSHFAGRHLPDTPTNSKILLQPAVGDHLVTMWSPEIIARTIGAQIHGPTKLDGDHPDDDPYFGIPAIQQYPFDGNALIMWDTGDFNPDTDTGTGFPPLINVGPTPADGVDPHESVRETATAREQKSAFLKIDGAVIDVCGMSPCLTDDYSGLSRPD